MNCHIYVKNIHRSLTHMPVVACGSLLQQDAQLSQRDRAAGCIIVFAKSRRLELVNYILRTL